MELLKVTNDGALHFQLSDGRIGASYPSGYVRVSTKSPNFYSKNIRMYQINKQVYTGHSPNYPDGHVVRELLPLQRDRLNHLMNFNENNCK